MDLKAVFRIQDRGSSQIRSITQGLSQLGRMGTTVTNNMNSTNAAVRRFSDTSVRTSHNVGTLKSSMSSMAATVGGVATAYLSARGAVSAFNATVGRAMALEASTVTIEALFNDKSASSSYMDMVKKMSIDSPVLNQTEMLSSSKGLIAMTKNVDELGKAWSIVEKLQVLDPTQGTDGAAFALKEMWQGDNQSMTERFGLSKKDLNRIKKLDVASQITEITKLLDGMGVTDEAIEKMAQTSQASLNGVQERFEAFLQVVGGDGNTTMGKFYRRLSGMFDSDNATKFANKLGDGLNTILTKAISIGDWLWKWKEPVAYVVGGLASAASAFMVIGTLSLLANPIALIGAAIGGAAVGMIALYKNSETFRGVIDSVKSKVGELWSAFKTGGTGGLLNSLFGDGTAEKVAGIVDKIKTKFGELQGGFSIVKDALAQGWSVISDVFANGWTLIQPFLSGLWSMLKIVGDYASIAFNNIIAPALNFAIQLFSTLWAVAQPILSLLGGLFQVLGAVITAVWKNILAPLMEFVTGAFKNAFDNLSGVLQIVSGWFETLGGWANTAKGYLSQFADTIANIKLPDWVTSGISTVVTTVGKAIGAGTVDGSHYNGLANVPFDGYVAKLHKNERVLTAQENKEYSGKGGGLGSGDITINMHGTTIREDADINRIADQLVSKLMERRGVGV